MGRAGRPLSPRVMRLLELLRSEGLMSVGELAERTGLTPRQVRHSLWGHLQMGSVELTYGLTREGVARIELSRAKSASKRARGARL